MFFNYFRYYFRTDNTVKHMKICCQTQKTQHKYYLSINKYFSSIEELVQNYENNSLKENFERYCLYKMAVLILISESDFSKIYLFQDWRKTPNLNGLTNKC